MPKTTEPPPRPLFPIGYPASIGYMGLARAGEPGCKRNGAALPLHNVQVIAVRLIPKDVEQTCPHCTAHPDRISDCTHCKGNGTEWAVEYPQGWEYGLASPKDGASVDGWYPEAELLEKEYQPPARPLVAGPLTEQQKAELVALVEREEGGRVVYLSAAQVLAEPENADSEWLETARGFTWDSDGESMSRRLSVAAGGPEVTCGIETNPRADNHTMATWLGLYWSTWPDKPKRSLNFGITDNPTRAEVDALLLGLGADLDPPKHTHEGPGDKCRRCGRDIRDTIHTSFGPAPVACELCNHIVAQLDGLPAVEGAQQVDGKTLCPACVKKVSEKAAGLDHGAIAAILGSTYRPLTGAEAASLKAGVIPDGLIAPTDEELLRRRDETLYFSTVNDPASFEPAVPMPTEKDLPQALADQRDDEPDGVLYPIPELLQAADDGNPHAAELDDDEPEEPTDIYDVIGGEG
jgi:hypothetical protein